LGFGNVRQRGWLDAVVHATEGIFVSFARLGSFGVSVMLTLVGGIPVFHGCHGVVQSGQFFFIANGIHPFIYGSFIDESQLIEISFAHAGSRVRARHRVVNRVGRI
jgi:hypothetical protein